MIDYIQDLKNLELLEAYEKSELKSVASYSRVKPLTGTEVCKFE